MARALWLILALAFALPAQADDVYQAPELFVAVAFGGRTPQAEQFLISGDLRTQAAAILGHDAPARVRYWRQDKRTAWVLEEIGKERPITVGVIIDADKLAQVEVLIYRESRGWEVRLPGFLGQFKGAGLRADGGLDRSIDNISGATLSVNALRRITQFALWCHRWVLAGV